MYESRNLSCFTWLVNIKMTVKHIQYVALPQLLKNLSSILAIVLESLNFFILLLIFITLVLGMVVNITTSTWTKCIIH